MNTEPICSENELRCRSRLSFDGNSVSDPWNSSSETDHERKGDVDTLLDNACFSEVQHLQEVEPMAEPITGVDDSDRQTSTPNKRQLI